MWLLFEPKDELRGLSSSFIFQRNFLNHLIGFQNIGSGAHFGSIPVGSVPDQRFGCGCLAFEETAHQFA